eukprot:3310385-Lingulodinium_polyedra.AAC.1
MMRSRGQRTARNGDARPVGPPWQRTAPAMLYLADSQSPTQSWRSMSLEPVVATIRDLVPPECQDAWKRLHQDARPRGHSPEE